MTTYKDLFIKLFLLLGIYVIPCYIIGIDVLLDNFWFGFPLALGLIAIYLIILKKLRDKKRISEILKQDLFNTFNYTILSERPLTVKEQYENFEFDFGPFINGISVNVLRYKNQMKRHFLVRNEKDHDFELIVTIVQTWNDKFKYTIESTSRIRN